MTHRKACDDARGEKSRKAARAPEGRRAAGCQQQVVQQHCALWADGVGGHAGGERPNDAAQQQGRHHCSAVRLDREAQVRGHGSQWCVEDPKLVA